MSKNVTPVQVIRPLGMSLMVGFAALACGPADEASPDSDANEVEVPVDHRQFVPDGLQLEIVEGSRAELELLAFTLKDGPEFLVAVRNNGAGLYCSAAVHAALYQGSGFSIASGVTPVFGTSVFRSAPGAPLWNCLHPGEVGFGGEVGALQGGADVSTAVRVPYQLVGYVGAELGAVVKDESVKVEGVRLRNGSSSATVEGSVRNTGSVPVVLRGVWVYSINRVGRPLAAGVRESSEVVGPGGVREFAVDVAGPVGDYRVLLDYSE